MNLFNARCQVAPLIIAAVNSVGPIVKKAKNAPKTGEIIKSKI